MARILWSEPALTDLRQIIQHISHEAPATASKLATRLVRATRRLARFPWSGQIVQEFDDPLLREIDEASYRIIYLIRDRVSHVVAVVHASRDIAELFRREELEQRIFPEP